MSQEYSWPSTDGSKTKAPNEKNSKHSFSTVGSIASA